MKEVLNAQDDLYTLVVKPADGTLEPRVIGSIIDYLLAPDDPEAVIERIAAIDAGFDPHVLAQMMDALNQFADSDLPVELDQIAPLRQFFHDWQTDSLP